MNIHEYQAKEILKSYDIDMPDFHVVSSFEEAEQIAKEYNINSGVVKVQVHSGGRGKSGGVRICHSQEELLKSVEMLLGMEFRNEQTSGEALIVDKVLISELVSIEKEYYFSVLIDRENSQIILMSSPEGGQDIEAVAQQHPEKIFKTSITYYGKIYDYRLRECCYSLGIPDFGINQVMNLFRKLVKIFYENDASLLEINPLVLTDRKMFSVLDAKMSFDDNALYRHPFLISYEENQLNSRESKAKKLGLSYISLNGNIGCLVNGAGLAMATLDVLRLENLSAANFLDIGGSASEEQVCEAIRILLSDQRIQVVFINVFGGIMDCAVLARGIVAVLKDYPSLTIPFVIRLEGTHADLGKEILKESSVVFELVQSMEEGAKSCGTLIRRGSL